MLLARTHNKVASLVLAGMVCLANPAAQAATPVKLSGAITGFVTDPGGVPQMGAAVFLFNRQERQFERAITDERGVFRFLGLSPDTYSVKVTLASFVPALKKGILVQPGMASVLNVNLNTLFSSIQFAYPPIDSGTLMTDEWKWALRSAGSDASGAAVQWRCAGSGCIILSPHGSFLATPARRVQGFGGRRFAAGLGRRE